jgi:hypothetical protein
MDDLQMSRPDLYNNKWLLWSDTVLGHVINTDCRDTIHGYCLKNKTMNECIAECTEDKGCAAGYYVKLNEKDKHGVDTICIPVRTDIHPTLNPAFRLKNKDLFPELDDLQITTFINKNVFPFPPNWANVVFYKDILTIENTQTKATIGKKDSEIEGGTPIYFDKDKEDDNIQIIPSQPTMPSGVKDLPICFGDNIQIIVPGTSLIMRQTALIEITWQITVSTIPDTSIRLIPVSKNHKIGDMICYGDEFIMTTSESQVIVLNHNTQFLTVKYDNIEDIITNKDKYAIFKFISKMNGYYCENNKCKSIPIKNTQVKGKSATYKNIPVSRNSNCWGKCESSFSSLESLDSSSSSWTPLIVIFSVVGFVFIVSLIYSRWKNNNVRYKS